ncbi:MAG: FAD-dependent oxidoreductase [Anaerolineales bacterium]|jgi:NADPH-dependent 2,4-dienoyl-CoA reductase/sulfur reductase-like enzyme/Fe-S-cluster-containing hydrogenase component 2/bacterioferritin-associated ferredoxin|nr:FAD-dependent oxidoreductase [Anaerolineales bacterium]
MTHNYRIESHPILPIPERQKITFTWQGQPLEGYAGETISAALFANGIRIFGYHPKDGSPQGIFCANGQCAQCTVIANGLPVKSCMTLLRPDMVVNPVTALPALPQAGPAAGFKPVRKLSVEVLILGGGPAGLSAAIELGKLGIQTLVVDDKHRLGGKLVLQTHRFFGSINACYAGTRGIDIATRLESDVRQYETVEIWLNSTAVAVFSDHKVGIVHSLMDEQGTSEYVLVEPQILLNATGAREKTLTFKGNTLPGVYGAGAFQTLVNRDLVRAAERLFIVGGGNVGLIAGYHALQAGIQVVGLVEALPECGGYKVHKDKLVRMGVPIYTSHTVVSANGKDSVESVTIAKIDEKWQPVPGTEQTFNCDTLLIAVGLDPVDEFYRKAKEFGMTVFAAGDADEIAEASAAMFSGKIRGLEIARSLGKAAQEAPPEWFRTAEILKSKPGAITHETIPDDEEVFPVIHCSQEIPCNPCTSVCSQGAIFIDESDIRQVPDYIAQKLGTTCIACEKCVTICPGLAITLVDRRKQQDTALVTIPYEYEKGSINVGDWVIVLDTTGKVLGKVEVVRTRIAKTTDRTILVKVRAPAEMAVHIAGIQVQEGWVSEPVDHWVERLEDDTMVCRCERVTLAEIKAIIRSGVRDMNEIKAITRAGMGACGGKTCGSLIKRAFRELGVPMSEVTENVARPMFVETPFGVLAGVEDQ